MAWFSLRHAVDVFHAVDLVEDLLQGRGHELFDLAGRVARHADHDVGQRHDDLRVLLARRDQQGRQPDQHRDDDQDDREVVVEEDDGRCR